MGIFNRMMDSFFGKPSQQSLQSALDSFNENKKGLEIGLANAKRRVDSERKFLTAVLQKMVQKSQLSVIAFETIQSEVSDLAGKTNNEMEELKARRLPELKTSPVAVGNFLKVINAAVDVNSSLNKLSDISKRITEIQQRMIELGYIPS